MVRLCLVLALLSLTCAVAAHAEVGDAEQAQVDTVGVVFAYGEQVYPPFVFTGVGTDTLFLNGYPLSPRRSSRRGSPEISVSETCKAQHELCVKAGQRAREGSTHAERVEIYAEVLRASSLVDSVRVTSHDIIYMSWAGETDEEEIILPREDTHFELADFHETRISEFWRAMRAGRLVAFGERYYVSAPRQSVPQTLQLLERIDEGGPPTKEEVAGTALQQPRFLVDLCEKRGISRTEDER